MKNALLAIAVTILAASPATAGPRGGSSHGSLVNVSGINVAALNGVSVLSNIASGNRTNVAIPVTVKGNRTNVLSGVTGIVGGLIGGGHGCGCN
jgi:hypothetical protein